MMRIAGLAISFMVSSVALIAAKNSQTFYLPADVRAGNVQLIRGICEVTWSTPTGSQVQLTIKMEDKKTVTVAARMVEGKQDRASVITSVVNGVTYLQELHTENAKFIFQGATDASGSKLANETLTFNGNGARRLKGIHWPDGFNPEQADLFAHNEIVVHASCAKVFANIVDAHVWQSWYPNSHDVRLQNSPDGKLHEGARFSWDTFGVHIESRVHEFVPNSRIGWFGDGSGMNAYHTFLLLRTHDRCHIVTEEVVKGPAAVEFREKQPNAMHEGHDLWLSTLKQRSEQ